MKLLHLEDDDADAELVRAAVQREWPDCEIVRLYTREAYEAAIDSGDYDLILSDHEIPGFSGISALEIAHARSPETPFIFLSGTIGEARAIEALRHGAADYVLKGAPARLIPAIRGVLKRVEEEKGRRRTERELYRSRERFQQIAESIDNFIVLLGEDGHCLYSNPAFRALFPHGGSPCDPSIFEHVHPEDVAQFRGFFEQAWYSDHPREITYRLRLPDGSVRHLEATFCLPQDRDQHRPTLLLSGRDVTERKLAEELLHEQASLLEKARDAICLLNLDYAITFWNSSAARIYGRPATEVLGRKVHEFTFTGESEHFDRAFALTLAQGEWHGEFRATHADGRALVIDSTWSLVNDLDGRPKSVLCIDTDITTRKQLEIELQRTQRLESIGMLAGGIAHDLGNLLSPILLSLAVLRPVIEHPDKLLVLDTAEASASNAAELVRQILLFARGEEGNRGEVRMGELLDQLRGFLRATLGRNIELQVEHDFELWPIFADATQLKQVVLNLCLNARDAMPLPGQISIVAANVDVAAGSLRGFHGEIPAGRHVRLSVADSGTGIPPDVLERIFDPFYTTKGKGKGTGLGLSTVAGVVRSHEGSIQVETVLGRGTTFHVYFPALETQ